MLTPLSLVLTYPNINPIAFSLGPLDVRWYGLMYVVGIFLAWKLAAYLLKNYKNAVSVQVLDDSILFLILGIVIGGRLGHVVFYDQALLWQNPLEIFRTWHGGMSFHGGILGVLLATYYCSRKNRIPMLSLIDIYACVGPLGLFFGRIGNFINGELWGRPTDVSWGMVFPYAGPVPRHPSQLYEAALEGILLLIVLVYCWTRTDMRLSPGKISGVFAIGYSVSRIFCEIFREPDFFLFGPITIGQALTIPMLVVGGILLLRKSPSQSCNTQYSL